MNVKLAKADIQALYNITREWVLDNHLCTRNDVEAEDIIRASRLREKFLRLCIRLNHDSL